jgi:hypothetical protein
MSQQDLVKFPMLVHTGVRVDTKDFLAADQINDAVEKGGDAFTAALNSITKLMQTSADKVAQNLSDAKSVTVECGLSLAVSGNIILAQVTATGDFNVSATWEKG